MLQQRHPRYEVSSSYALFVAILCWSTQRLRTDTKKDNSPEACAAANVWAEFEGEPISCAPWSINIVDDTLSGGETGGSFASADFRDHTASRLIKNLRDAVAHGDARKVEPYHIATKTHRTLIGFTFKCEEGHRNKKREWITDWTGTITLHAGDMARIAGEVAQRFCWAMEKMSANSCRKKEATKLEEAA
jgi:hypothetical protein